MNLVLGVPSDFAKFYTEWLQSKAYTDLKADAKAALAKKITIAVNTANMTVKAADTKKGTPADDTIDLDVVTINGVSPDAVDIVLAGEFKFEKELVLSTGNTENAYKVTLPETSAGKAFKLDVCGTMATLKIESAGTTEIDILTPKILNYKSDRRGLLIGDGIVVNALNPVDGNVLVDGGEIKAMAIIPGYTPANGRSRSRVYEKDEDGNYVVDEDGRLVPSVDEDGNAVYELTGYSYNFSYVNYEGGIGLYRYGYEYDENGNSGDYHSCYVWGDPASTYDYSNLAYVNTVKVFKGDGMPATVDVNANNYLILSKLEVADDANVTLNGTSVTEIVGGSKKTGKVYISAWDYTAWTSTQTTGNIEKISNVTITNSGTINLKSNVENCIFSNAARLNVYPEAEEVKGSEFPNVSKVYVYAPAQVEGVSTYTQTFTGCKFPNTSALFNLASNSADAQLILDAEGNPITRKCWYYYYQDSYGYWYIQQVNDESLIPEEAKLLDPKGEGKYWWEDVDYAYYSTGFENAKDYTVIIDLDGCKTTKGAKIDETLEIYTAGGSKPALRYAFGGSDLYKGVSGYWDHEDPSHVILIKDSKR